MEKVWKRVSSGKKPPLPPPNKSKDVLNKKVAKCSSEQQHDKLKDYLWCDLVKTSDLQTVPIDDSPDADEEEAAAQRRRRLRRAKGFSFNFDTHLMEFNPIVLTRKLCKVGGRKRDNELYRSNSFKFERFVRPEEENTQIQVTVCEDYCIPVDFVNKKKAYSFGAGLSHWTTPSPSGDKVQIFETYSDPKDSKTYLEPGEEPSTKVYTSPEQEYTTPCNSNNKSPPLPPPPQLPENNVRKFKTKRIEIIQHDQHSPYYYADLNGKSHNHHHSHHHHHHHHHKHKKHHHKHKLKHSISLDSHTINNKETAVASTQTINSVIKEERKNKQLLSVINCDTIYDADIESPLSEIAPRIKVKRTHGVKSSKMPCDSSLVIAVRSCISADKLNEEDDDEYYEDMNGKPSRRVYETAFDSRIQKSDDELEEMDRVSNHPVLRMFNRATRGLTPRSSKKADSSPKVDCKPIINNKEIITKAAPDDGEEGTSGMQNNIKPVSAIPEHLTNEISALRLTSTPPPTSGSSNAPSPPPFREYAPSPPSTAPLPTKFHNNIAMNSIQSAPDLPAGSPARFKDLHLPVKSLRGRIDKVREFKGRPNSLVLTSNNATSSTQHHKPKYSSTESMATSNSSSMSSLESIRSSTSEGNRSTTSSGSRQSDSLSSHSSDSTNDLRHHRTLILHQRGPLGLLSNKLHILSPISDKSQEPASETSDNNRNNNSQKGSPEDGQQQQQQSPTTTIVDDTNDLPWDAPKLRRNRQLQNKNLINLQLALPIEQNETLQGSDSGISIESQGRYLTDLPFDMPKLRRRLQAATRDTSSSATSVASKPDESFNDLPFDMPKLRRRQLRPASAFEPLGIKQRTDSDSNPTDSSSGGQQRPNLSLDLAGPSSFRPVRPGGLSLNFGYSAFTVRGEAVDQRIPLERQGWFHGAITRIEAEAELRLHQEGSYLVRNSESSRHDFSLSLKSSRGFMHMRIQQDPATKQYILGQFSKPFASIPEMVHYYSINRLPIRGAEHMCLLHPVIEQLL